MKRCNKLCDIEEDCKWLMLKINKMLNGIEYSVCLCLTLSRGLQFTKPTGQDRKGYEVNLTHEVRFIIIIIKQWNLIQYVRLTIK